MWSDTCTTAEDTRSATKELSCTDPLSARSRVYRSSVYDTLQSVTTAVCFVRTLMYTMLVRTICFCCTRVDEQVGDDRYRAKNAAHIADCTRA